jgi:putative hemolysin
MGILIIVILILINGFFALSEIALVSSRKIKLEQLKAEDKKGASIALWLQDRSEDYLSAIQVGITLVGIIMGVYGGLRIADDVKPLFEMMAFTEPYAREIALVLTVFLITYVSIVIGELVPKTIALSNPEGIAVKVAPVIYYFSKIFYPFVRLLSFSTNLVNGIIGVQHQSEKITQAELRQMLKVASNEGVIQQEQNVIHEKLFYFSDKYARHLMTHRNEVEWLDLEKPEQDIKTQILSTPHGILVCCRETPDNFLGVLYLRDYLKAITAGKDLKLEELIIKPYIVTDNSPAQKVLEIFKIEKIHICIVVDENGRFSGIITLHDIIEHIVGQIPDEGEEYEPEIFMRDDGSVLVNGDAPVELLSDLIEGFHIDFGNIDYSSVAGYVLNQLQKLPVTGDKLELLDYVMEVVDMDGKRIDKILVYKKGNNLKFEV